VNPTYRPLEPHELRERAHQVPGFREKPPRDLPYFVTEDLGDGDGPRERFAFAPAARVRELLERGHATPRP
jgi:hypothetical protein